MPGGQMNCTITSWDVHTDYRENWGGLVRNVGVLSPCLGQLNFLSGKGQHKRRSHHVGINRLGQKKDPAPPYRGHRKPKFPTHLISYRVRRPGPVLAMLRQQPGQGIVYLQPGESCSRQQSLGCVFGSSPLSPPSSQSATTAHLLPTALAFLVSRPLMEIESLSGIVSRGRWRGCAWQVDASCGSRQSCYFPRDRMAGRVKERAVIRCAV